MSTTLFTPLQNTLSLAGPDAFSAGGQTLTASNGATFSTAHPRSGTHGGHYPAGFDCHVIAPASILNYAQGAIAFSFYVTAWLDGAWLGGSTELAEPGNNLSVRLLGAAGSGNFRFQISHPTNGFTDIDTTGLNAGNNMMIDVLLRWHAANGWGRIELRNGVVGSAQNLSIPTASFPVSAHDNFFLGDFFGGEINMFGDTWMAGDTYGEPLENYHGYSSYSQIAGSGPVRGPLPFPRVIRV